MKIIDKNKVRKNKKKIYIYIYIYIYLQIPRGVLTIKDDGTFKARLVGERIMLLYCLTNKANI